MDALILGDYRLGAYGPAIILKLMSPESAEWLHDVLTRLVDGGSVVDLASAPEVHINNVRSLKLRRVLRMGNAALRGPSAPVTDAEFEWALDEAGWSSVAGLLEPFLRGETGHQYLTDEGSDAALIEVTFGETDVRVPGE